MALRCFLQVWCGRGGSTNFFLCVASLCERLCNATLHSPSAAAELTCYSVGATPSNYFLVLLRPLCDAWPHPPRARNAGSQARLRSRSDHFLIQVVDWNLMVFLAPVFSWLQWRHVPQNLFKARSLHQRNCSTQLNQERLLLFGIRAFFELLSAYKSLI